MGIRDKWSVHKGSTDRKSLFFTAIPKPTNIMQPLVITSELYYFRMVYPCRTCYHVQGKII